MTSQIVRVFLEVDMRNSHKGLGEIARRHHISVSSLRDGDLVVFINKSRTIMKLYGSRNTLVFTKSEEQPIDLAAIQHIPKIFNQRKTVNIGKALKMRLVKKLPSTYTSGSTWAKNKTSRISHAKRN